MIAGVFDDLRARPRPHVEDLIQLHILTSTLAASKLLPAPPDDPVRKTVHAAQQWTTQALGKLDDAPGVIPALVRGTNLAAEMDLGFTEPFGRLSLQLRDLLEQAVDQQPLGYVLSQLGAGVAPDSPYLAALEVLRFQALTHPALLDALIREQEQRLQVVGRQAIMQTTAANQVQGDTRQAHELFKQALKSVEDRAYSNPVEFGPGAEAYRRYKLVACENFGRLQRNFDAKLATVVFQEQARTAQCS